MEITVPRTGAIPQNWRQSSTRVTTVLAEPQRIGEFSVSREREVTLDRSNAGYLYEQPILDRNVTLNLNQGIEMFEPWTLGQDEKLNIMFEWMMQSKPDGGNISEVFGTDVIAWRGLLKRIAATPYMWDRPWMFVATKKNDVVYLCQKELERVGDTSYMDNMYNFWGHKFEQYMTVRRGEAEPDVHLPVTCCEEFRVVCSTSLRRGNQPPIRLLLAAEIDAIDEDDNLVEIKTHKVKGGLDDSYWKYPRSSMNTFLQCQLVGIKQVVIGLRTAAKNDGIVREVISLSTDELERKDLARWKSATCYDFLYTVLNSVKKWLKNDTSCRVSFPAKSRSVKLEPIEVETEPILNAAFKTHFNID